MAVRINENSCKNALGTVFLLATAFFVCSTFISMRSVFADPIAPQNAGVVSTGRQSPRSSQRTSNQTISRSTVSRGTTGATVVPSRSTVSRGTATSRTVSSRSTAPTRQSANVVSRNVSSRGQATRSSANNRAVRARTATNATRVAATGNVTSGGDRASVNTTYSYLNSRLYTGNYSNIIDSTTGLISAEAYSNCMDSYYACMDEICTARSAAKGRCSCAGRANNFLAAEEQLEKANEELITLSGQLSLLIATKGKGDEIASAFTLTEAEQVMNCVSWQEAVNAAKTGQIKDSEGNTVSAADHMKQWCTDHALDSNSCSESKKPQYCTNNTYGFSLESLSSDNITGSSSDILAQLKAWANAKELADQYKDNTDTMIDRYTSLNSTVRQLVGGSTVTENTDKDRLKLKWGYKLFEYAHNNVCGRVLDSCFNGIFEACGTPPTVKDSDGIEHKKCMNGLTSQCPFNYNSYIYVNTNATSDNYGDIELHERGSANGNPSSTASAQCFGYSTTTSSTGTRTTTSSSDPYYNLRGPVADARRSIMQKYLLDANAACDVYGESLTNTAQNINYQKVAAQQALQQKRLEFKQQEDSETESNYTTYASNFVSCIDEIWDCYIDTADSETWTKARIKTYCAQKSQVPHCYEPMVCSPSRLALSAVIDKPDDTQCTFAQDFRKNTCRNVVTISEILYGANSAQNRYDKYEELTYSDSTKIDSAKLRESCLQEAGVADVRAWGKVAQDTYSCSITQVTAKDPNAKAGYNTTDKTEGECEVITDCRSGYFYNKNTKKCELVSVDCTDEFDSTPGVNKATRTVNDTYLLGECKIVECEEHYTLHSADNKCVPDTASCSMPHATSATATWNGTNFVCKASACSVDYHVEEGVCVPDDADCTSEEVMAIDPYAKAGTKKWNTGSNDYGECKLTECKANASVNSAGKCACNSGYSWNGTACGTSVEP